MLEMLDYTIRIGSIPTFLYFTMLQYCMTELSTTVYTFFLLVFLIMNTVVQAYSVAIYYK